MPFPSSVVLRTPVVRTLAMPTRVVEFLDGSEQRWVEGDPLNAFALEFQNASAAEVTAVENWFASVKGAFDTTWSFTSVDGVTYPDMALEHDELPLVERAAARFGFSVKMRQVAPDGDYSATADPVYPALPNGVYTQRPFTRNTRFRTVRNDLDSGPRYARYEWGTPKRAWICDYPVLTLAELEGRLAFFIAMRGRYRGFEFHDPELDDDFANCRFDTDQFVARALGAGQWAVTLPVAEFTV